MYVYECVYQCFPSDHSIHTDHLTKRHFWGSVLSRRFLWNCSAHTHTHSHAHMHLLMILSDCPTFSHSISLSNYLYIYLCVCLSLSMRSAKFELNSSINQNALFSLLPLSLYLQLSFSVSYCCVHLQNDPHLLPQTNKKPARICKNAKWNKKKETNKQTSKRTNKIGWNSNKIWYTKMQSMCLSSVCILSINRFRPFR